MYLTRCRLEHGLHSARRGGPKPPRAAKPRQGVPQGVEVLHRELRLQGRANPLRHRREVPARETGCRWG